MNMTQLQKDNWFTTPIFSGYWDECEEHNKKMLKEILRLRKTVQSNNRSSVNGWQSVKNLYDFEFVQTLSGIMKIYVVQALMDLNLDLPKNDLFISQMWANVNPPNSYNVSHQHPDSFLSGVYYLQTPENSGSLVFEDVRNPFCLSQASFSNLDEFSSTEVVKDPKPGEFFLFPSYLSHRVGMNMSREDRVSISFNVSISNK
jgi:uncharacterized protein (TIGR02466 family)